jgi:hypothetical protein
MSGGGDFVQRGEKNIAKTEINVLNLRKREVQYLLEFGKTQN